MDDQPTFDVLVIGAGVGGLSAAARLAHAGHRVLVVEADERIGGRASSREVDGFILNTGALAVERDGPVADLYADLGLHLDLDVPRPETVALWGRRRINASGGPAGQARAVVPIALRALTTRFPRLRPGPGESTSEWLNRFTRHRRVHNIVDNICGSFFAVAGADLPADVFLHYMADGSAFKKLGFAPGGTIEVWKPLAEYVCAHGGDVWLESAATSILTESGRALGAVIERAGETTTVTAATVISNIGPGSTARLIDPSALPADYARTIDDTTTTGTILTVHFASPEPLADWPAIGLATRSRRLTYLYNCSAPAQRRVARPGWHLYAAAATPRPATGPVDVEGEKQLLLADLRDHLPGFDEHATILAWDVNDEHNPAQRSVSGYDHPVDTPIPNLWNVGDGVKPWGDAGTSACVRSADEVVSRILAIQASRAGHTTV